MEVHAVKHTVRFEPFITKCWHSPLPCFWVWVMSLLLTKCQCYLSPSNIYVTSDCHLLVMGQNTGQTAIVNVSFTLFPQDNPLRCLHPPGKMGYLSHVNVQHVTTEDKIWFTQHHFQKIVSLFPTISNHKALINISHILILEILFHKNLMRWHIN